MKIAQTRARLARVSLKKSLAWVWRATGSPKPREIAALAGLVFVWAGLRDIYQPAAPIVVGAFLVWFTTIRRVVQ